MASGNTILAFTVYLAFIGFAGTKPKVLHPARTAGEAAEVFYPEIKKVLELHQRWAARAAGAELDSCRHEFRVAMRDAFSHYNVSRRNEFMQTRWPSTYSVMCRGKRGKIKNCTASFAAPLGREFDTTGMLVRGRGLTTKPFLSRDGRYLEAMVLKKGEGRSRIRIILSTKRTVQDIERELSRELIEIRRKLELHGLPSDVTIEKFLPHR